MLPDQYTRFIFRVFLACAAAVYLTSHNPREDAKSIVHSVYNGYAICQQWLLPEHPIQTAVYLDDDGVFVIANHPETTFELRDSNITICLLLGTESYEFTHAVWRHAALLAICEESHLDNMTLPSMRRVRPMVHSVQALYENPQDAYAEFVAKVAALNATASGSTREAKDDDEDEDDDEEEKMNRTPVLLRPSKIYIEDRILQLERNVESLRAKVDLLTSRVLPVNTILSQLPKPPPAPPSQAPPAPDPATEKIELETQC